MVNMIVLVLILVLINSSSSYINKNQYISINSNTRNRNNNSNNNIIVSSLSSTSLTKDTYSSNIDNISILKQQWLDITNQSKVSQDITTLLLSIIVGAVVGYSIQLLKNTITLLEVYRTKSPLVLPIVGTILISYLYTIQSDLSVGPASIYSNDDKSFSIRRQLLRIIAITIAIGTGNALALAGPAAELGITIARIIGFSFLSTEESRRLLCLAGSAAGFSANFWTPISGVLFAMEFSNLQMVDVSQKKSTSSHKSLVTKSLSFSMVAAVTSVIIARKGVVEPFKHFLSKFVFDNNGLFTMQQLLLTSLIGISSGIISKIYRSSIVNLSSLFKNIPMKVKPLICGTLCGVAALYGLPQSLAKGFVALDEIVSGRLVKVLPLVLFFSVRLIMLVIANATGILGGTVAPSIFIGASFGVLMNLFFNGIGILNTSSSVSSLLALVGGASFFSAFFRSPLTATMLLLEFTRNVDLVIPLLLGTSLATIFS
jgi:CIC family chloride channel protein